MWRRIDLVRIDVSAELIATIIRVKRISELRTLAVTSNCNTLLSHLQASFRNDSLYEGIKRWLHVIYVNNFLSHRQKSGHVINLTRPLHWCVFVPVSMQELNSCFRFVRHIHTLFLLSALNGWRHFNPNFSSAGLIKCIAYGKSLHQNKINIFVAINTTECKSVRENATISLWSLWVHYGRRSSAVGVAIGHVLTTQGRSSSPDNLKNCYFSASSRSALGLKQRSIHCVPGTLPPSAKLQDREADHWFSSSAEVKKMWIYTSTPP
jgi:hypothetical protein